MRVFPGLSFRYIGWMSFLLLFIVVSFSGCGVSDYSSDLLTPERVYDNPDSLGKFDSFVAIVIRVLDSLYGYFGSYALALLAIPAIVRILLAPLVWRQQLAQVKMRKLWPEVRKIQEKYRGDRVKAQQAMQDLYTMHGTSQMAPFGCLPLLLQTPIFIGLFQAALRYTPLRGEQFLIWDIGEKDPYYLMPLFVAVIMFLVQIVNFSIQGNQAKNPGIANVQIPKPVLLIIGPLITFWFSSNVPVAACLYFFASNAISLLQALVFYYFYIRPRRLREQRSAVQERSSTKKGANKEQLVEKEIIEAEAQVSSAPVSSDPVKSKKKKNKSKKKRKK